MKVLIRRGLAPGFDVKQSMSPAAMRRLALYTRPQTRVLPWTPASEVGVDLGRRVGHLGHVHGSHEDVFVVIAPPRSYKTPFLADIGSRMPGAVVTATTKPDLFRMCCGLRDPATTQVFNPEGIEGLPSDLRWAPELGCARPATAKMRAGHFIGGTPANAGGGKAGGDRAYWEGQAVELLAGLLSAADVGGYDMHDVAKWTMSPADETAPEILEDADEVSERWAAALRRIYGMREAAKKSVFDTAASALGFMSDPDLARAACPEDGELMFDVARFLDRRGTLHMIATARPYGGLGPLFAAFSGNLIETAKRLADNTPTGRLDPPLGVVLDEAPNICRLPIPQLSADCGGRGITLVVSVQSQAQLERGWGDDGADEINGNAGVKVVFGGGADEDYLGSLSRLAGTRFSRNRSYSDSGFSDSAAEVPVYSTSALRELPRSRAVILHRNTRVVEVQVPSIRDRRAYRKVQP